MNAAVLDTLRCARTLQTAGFPPAQAEAMAQVLADALSDVATKADLDNAVGSLKSSIAHLDSKFETKLESAVGSLESSIAQLDSKFETKLESAVGSLESSIAHLDSKFETKLESAVGGLESRIAQLDDKLESAVAHLDQKFDFLRDEIKNQARLTLIILSAIVTLFLGAIVALSFPWGAPATAPPQAAEFTIPTPDAQAAPQPKPPGAPPPSSQPAST